jgi:hypothetical protein
MIITKNSTTPEALRETMSSTQSMFRVAAIQMASGPNVPANLQEAGRLIELAAATGARIIALPEYFAIMGMKDTDKVAARERDGRGPIQDFLADTARRHKVWIVGGSAPLESNTEGKVRNACLVYNQLGERVARYDKIHLFGFEMGNEKYTEERTIEPGTQVCTVDSPYGRLGISVCYDLRFPELYRALGVHRDHRQGPLGHPDPGAGDREPGLRGGPGPGRLPRERSGNARSYHDRGSVGGGAGPPAAGLRGCGGRGQPHLSTEDPPQPAGSDAQDRAAVVRVAGAKPERRSPQMAANGRR